MQQPEQGRPKRKIDARSLRGLAHPLRMQLLQLLRLDGPATATGLARRLGENTGTTSWHLRQLAEHGFIEEDPDRGNRRERWWRAVNESTVLRGGEFLDDPETRDALETVVGEWLDHNHARAATFLTEADQWDHDWHTAATMSDWDDMRLTPDRLRALNEELFAVVERHRAAGDPDEPGAEQVIVQLQSFPRRRRTET